MNDTAEQLYRDEQAPGGYHYAWRKDNQWESPALHSKCRQPRCPNPAVATFHRYSFALKKSRPYSYCADHLYGRKIMNGVVMHRILVPNASS